MKKLFSLCAITVVALFAFASVGVAQTNHGSGPGCSAIEWVVATQLGVGDYFVGRIGTTAVSGVNKNGKPAEDSDVDGITDSLEECINDSLVGYCDISPSTVVVTPLATAGKNNNQQWFRVEFTAVGSCAVTQCSNRSDDDLDGETDWPDDPECVDYADDDESQ